MAVKDMKVLGIGPLYFRLPATFEGTVGDALRLMADYHESDHAKAQYVEGDDPQADEHLAVVQAVWSQFLDAVEKGYRTYGMMSRCRITDGKTIIEELG